MQLNGGLILSKLDLSEAYLQIPVDEKYAEIISTHTKSSINSLDYPGQQFFTFGMLSRFLQLI